MTTFSTRRIGADASRPGGTAGCELVVGRRLSDGDFVNVIVRKRCLPTIQKINAAAWFVSNNHHHQNQTNY
jgi:hypothetical protein